MNETLFPSEYQYINDTLSIAVLIKPTSTSVSYTHLIQLKVTACSDYISCRINETVMTVALQHLLNKMIDNTPPDGFIKIILSHSASSWELRISNCEKIRNGILKMIPAMPCLLYTS